MNCYFVDIFAQMASYLQGNTQVHHQLQITMQEMSKKRPAPYSIDEKTLNTTENEKQNEAIVKEEDNVDRIILKIKKDLLEPKPKQVHPKQTVQKNKTLPTKKQDLPHQQTKDIPNAQNKNVPLFKKPQLPDAPTNRSFLADLFKTKQGCGIFAKMGLFAGFDKIPPNQKIPDYLGSGNFRLPPRPKEMEQKFTSFFRFGQGGAIPPVKNAGPAKPIKSTQASLPVVKKQNTGEEEDDGDSAELQKDQNLVIDKSKSKGNYKYEEELIVVASSPARKYKKNNGDLIESVEVILQFDEKNQVYYLIVRLTATKHNIFTGLILPGKSQVHVLNGKEQNIGVSAFVVKQGKIAEKDHLKIQFETAEQGRLFYSKLAIATNQAGEVKEEPLQEPIILQPMRENQINTKNQ